MESVDTAPPSPDSKNCPNRLSAVSAVNAREEMWSGWGKAKFHENLKIVLVELKLCSDGILGLVK